MRITQQIKSKKSSYRHKVRKKRHKSRSTIGCTPGVSILDLENINEVLRINRVLLVSIRKIKLKLFIVVCNYFIY